MTVRPSSKLPRLIAPLAIVAAALALVLVVVTSLDFDASSGGTAAPDPSAVEVQEELTPTGFGRNYEVQPGDSFSTIAEETGVPVDVLSQLNPDLDPQTLAPGQRVKLR